MACGKPPEHDADHGEADERSDGGGIAFEVARQTVVAADPCECPLDVRSTDDLQASSTGAPYGQCHLASGISAISKNVFDDREQSSGSAQQMESTITRQTHGCGVYHKNCRTSQGRARAWSWIRTFRNNRTDGEVTASEAYLPPLRRRIVEECGGDPDWENESVYEHQIGLDFMRPGDLLADRPVAELKLHPAAGIGAELFVHATSSLVVR